MIVKREKIYTKKDGILYNVTIKQTSFWLFGIIPLYIKNEIIKRSY